MKISLFTILFLCISFFVFSQNDDTLMIRGVFNGKNLYIQNPEDTDGYGFCATGVLVNGKVPYEGGSAFEIDLSSVVGIGDIVEVIVFHHRGCYPKILNPEDILPKSTFEIVEMYFDSTGVLHWTSNFETGFLTYQVQQYLWNKWVTVAEIKEKSYGQNSYSYQPHFTSGKNLFRLKQVDFTDEPRCSDELKINPNKPEVTMEQDKKNREIIFSEETRYEVYDAYGNIVKKGFGYRIDYQNLKRGEYYVNYDSFCRKIFVL